MRIALPDEDAEIELVPASGGHKPELASCNGQFRNIDWTD